MVDCPDGQAALGLECRPTLCPEGYVESGGRCAFSFGSECLGGFVTLNNTNQYVLVNNNTLLYNDQILTIVEVDLNGQPVVCINNSRFGEFFNVPAV